MVLQKYVSVARWYFSRFPVPFHWILLPTSGASFYPGCEAWIPRQSDYWFIWSIYQNKHQLFPWKIVPHIWQQNSHSVETTICSLHSSVETASSSLAPSVKSTRASLNTSVELLELFWTLVWKLLGLVWTLVWKLLEPVWTLVWKLLELVWTLVWEQLELVWTLVWKF